MYSLFPVDTSSFDTDVKCRMQPAHAQKFHSRPAISVMTGSNIGNTKVTGLTTDWPVIGCVYPISATPFLFFRSGDSTGAVSE